MTCTVVLADCQTVRVHSSGIHKMYAVSVAWFYWDFSLPVLTECVLCLLAHKLYFLCVVGF